jgi:hypothetical protein
MRKLHFTPDTCHFRASAHGEFVQVLYDLPTSSIAESGQLGPIVNDYVCIQADLNVVYFSQA